MVDGRRGVRQTWPGALVGGVAFAIGQFVTSNYISVELTDIVASLVSAGAIVLFLRIWQPAEPVRAEETRGFTRTGPAAVAGAESYNPALERDIREREQHDTPRQVVEAYLPYVIIIAVFSIAQIGAVKDALDSVTKEFNWPGLNVVDSSGEASGFVTFKFTWLSSAGTLLLISGAITMLALRVRPGLAVRAYGKTLNQLKWAILTVAAVLSLAFVMNLSGETITLGMWLAGAGGFFAFLSSLLGWLGVAVTGSDTSSNSLFGALQVTAAKNAGLSPTLMAAANSSGGVLGKMISPQNLAIGAAAVGMAGEEGTIFRKVIGWSLLLILIMCVLVYLQSTAVLDWMVVK